MLRRGTDEDHMPTDTFADALAQDLRLRGHEVDSADVRKFAAAVASWVTDMPDLDHWTSEYLASQLPRAADVALR
jgi:hypothetical protein